MTEIQAEYEDMRRRIESKHDDSDHYSRELAKLQDKHREVLAQLHTLQTAREHLEASLRLRDEQMQRIQQEKEEQAILFRKERAELQKQVQDVIGTEERQRVEKDSRADRYREKAQ